MSAGIFDVFTYRDRGEQYKHKSHVANLQEIMMLGQGHLEIVSWKLGKMVETGEIEDVVAHRLILLIEWLLERRRDRCGGRPLDLRAGEVYAVTGVGGYRHRREDTCTQNFIVGRD